ncbi:MAG: hypothetical protein Kow00124_23620 [Anaerolineae bacterium]
MFGLTPATLISRAIVLLVAVVVHEFAHAYVAHLMGDNTAKEQGRMTLDPRANVYWPGYIVGILIGFAILGSAPVNPYRMRNQRWGMFYAVLAGPVSNLLVAVVAAIPFMLGLLTPSAGGGGLQILPTPAQIMTDMVWLNVLLFVFNLLPLAPLDGWTVVLAALPARPAVWWERQRQTSSLIMWGLILLSFVGDTVVATLPPGWRTPLAAAILNPLGFLIGEPSLAIVRFLFGLG